MEDLAGGLKPLGMIELIAKSPYPATLAELASTAGVPKPTAHRWLGALEAAGLVQRTPDGRHYELAPRAAALAFSILTNRPGGNVRHEILRRVVDAVGEACNLTVLSGTNVAYLDRVESTWPLRISFQAGSIVPTYCSASGKLFLALMRASKRDMILKVTTLERHTGNTITDKRILLRELTEIRANGYALDREEFMSGLVCIAVPVLRPKARGRECIAALAIQAPVTRMTHDALLEKLPLLRKAAEELTATLGE